MDTKESSINEGQEGVLEMVVSTRLEITTYY